MSEPQGGRAAGPGGDAAGAGGGAAVNRGVVTAAVMVAMSLAALDTTVVGTAMPTIIGALGGLRQFSWVFSAYLLTAATTVPLYGRLSDIYGRRPVFLAGAGIFLLGSGLSGLAHSMNELIAFRAVQGLGAGAIMPVTQTIIGDLFDLEERARMQGYFSSVWGVSAVVGPFLGGLIVDHVGWRWVFYINLPVGVVAMLLLGLCFRERLGRRRHSLDLVGSGALMFGLAALLAALLARGVAALVLAGLAAALLAAFLWQERRASEPALPLELFRHRVIGVTSVGGLLAGVVLIGLSTEVPLYVQGVLGGSATNAGAVLMPFSVAWPFGSALGGQLILRLGYRSTMVVGGALIAAGTLMLLGLGAGTPQAVLVAALAVAGAGFGFTVTPYVIAVQNAVGWERRGVATAVNQFLRNLGQSVGAAVLGAVLNARLAAALVGGPGAANALLDPVARAGLPPLRAEAMRGALMGGLHATFVWIAVTALLVLAVAAAMPGGRAERYAGER